MSTLALSRAELNRLREWFDAVEDLNPGYLQPRDYALACRLCEALGATVPIRFRIARDLSDPWEPG